MDIHYNTEVMPSLVLTKLETHELENSGKVVDEESGYIIVKKDGHYYVGKITDNYENIKLDY